MSVRAIANAVGVSPATVSRSLNNSPDVSESVRLKVVAEAQRLGYHRTRKTANSRVVGMLFFNDTSGPQFSGYDGVIWGGVTRAAMSLNYDVSIVNPLDRGSDESFASFITRKGLEAVILRVDAESRHHAIEIANEGIPHVVIADRYDDSRVSYISCNSFEPSRAAISHLFQLGHRRIACCHNVVLDTDHRDRIDGYRKAHAEQGMEPISELVISANADIGGGIAAFNRLMSLSESPTAIFLTDPALTVGVLRRAMEVGIRVPDELSIIGVDDERLRKMIFPSYTAVCQNAGELGQQAGRWLCRQLTTRSNSRAAPTLRLEIEGFLEINQTTAPPPSETVRVTPTGMRISETNGQNTGELRR